MINSVEDQDDYDDYDDDDDDEMIFTLREWASRCFEIADLFEKWPSFRDALMMTELGVYHLVDMSMLDLVALLERLRSRIMRITLIDLYST